MAKTRIRTHKNVGERIDFTYDSAANMFTIFDHDGYKWNSLQIPLSGSATAGVNTLNGLQGDIVLKSNTGTITLTKDTENNGISIDVDDQGLPLPSDIKNEIVNTNQLQTTLTLADGGSLISTPITLPSGGTANYNDLTNKPQINGIELTGNKTSENLNIVQQRATDSTNTVLSVVDNVGADILLSVDNGSSGNYSRVQLTEADFKLYFKPGQKRVLANDSIMTKGDTDSLYKNTTYAFKDTNDGWSVQGSDGSSYSHKDLGGPAAIYRNFVSLTTSIKDSSGDSVDVYVEITLDLDVAIDSNISMQIFKDHLCAWLYLHGFTSSSNMHPAIGATIDKNNTGTIIGMCSSNGLVLDFFGGGVLMGLILDSGNVGNWNLVRVKTITLPMGGW